MSRHSAASIEEHPSLRQAIETGQPINGPVDRAGSGPDARANLERFGITHGAYVPIRLHGEITGTLNASGRGEAIEPGLFGRLLLLGTITARPHRIEGPVLGGLHRGLASTRADVR